jgi:Cu(I)/Ag(I) efflux system membrane protein CusA/SilA
MLDMLSTGIRTPIGVKVIGTDLVEIDKLAKQIEQVLKAVLGTSSAYAERGIGGYYLACRLIEAIVENAAGLFWDIQPGMVEPSWNL